MIENIETNILIVASAITVLLINILRDAEIISQYTSRKHLAMYLVSVGLTLLVGILIFHFL